MTVLVNPYMYTATFTPASLTDLRGWWDVSDEGSITSSSGAISQIADLSGNGNHFVQSTAGNKPTLSADAPSGRNVATFDGVNDSMTAPDATSLDLTQCSIFIALTMVSSGATANILSKDSAQIYEGYTIKMDGSYLRCLPNSEVAVVYALHPYTGRHVLGMMYDQVTVRARYDGAIYPSIGTLSYTTALRNGSQGLVLGGSGSAFVNIAVIGSTTAATVEAYLKGKWSTT